MSANQQASIRRKPQPNAADARNFGLVLAGVWGVFGLWPSWFRGESPRLVVLSLATLLLGCALLKPQVLLPALRIWQRLGRVLESLLTPVLMAILFFLILTPFALLMRLVRGRSLPLEADPQLLSYWLERPKHLSRSDHFRNQF